MDFVSEEGRQVFERIREKPYILTTAPDEVSPNCFFKGQELLTELVNRGFAVRARIGEMDWAETPLPDEIVCLHPKEHQATHFYLERYDNGKWVSLDASCDPELERLGFQVGEWDGKNSPNFKIINLFNHERHIQYFNKWNDQNYVNSYFDDAKEFLVKVNLWLKENR